jgi:hypothetical protein
MRALLIAVASVATIIVACTTDSRTRCSTASDCTNSDESRAAGRCAPEVACTRDGHCYADCLGRCSIDSENRFPPPPCENGGICNQSVRNTGVVSGSFQCTRREIHCTDPSDCPIQKPSTEGEWSCASGICRFPNHEWDFE